MEHPHQAPASQITVRTPQCGCTVWGMKKWTPWMPKIFPAIIQPMKPFSLRMNLFCILTKLSITAPGAAHTWLWKQSGQFLPTRHWQLAPLGATDWISPCHAEVPYTWYYYYCYYYCYYHHYHLSIWMRPYGATSSTYYSISCFQSLPSGKWFLHFEPSWPYSKQIYGK